MNFCNYHVKGLTLLILLTLLPITEVKARQLYTMADLEILQQQKSYKEFFTHAKDIVPRKRTVHWSNMVKSMANSFIDQEIKLNEYQPNSVKRVESLANWSLLKTDQLFQMKRNRFQIKALKSCLKKQKFDLCYQQANHFWKRSNKDPDIGHRLAEIFYNTSPALELWSFLGDVANHHQGEFYCHKTMVTEKFIQYMFKSYNPKASPEKAKTWMNDNIHPSCWKKMTSNLKEFIFKGPKQYRNFVFHLLTYKEALTTTERDQYLTLFLLESPNPGPIFNMAWNNMNKLREDHFRREKLINFLTSLDPLPGDVFKNTKLGKTMAKLFAENFSEYLMAYAKTCLSYLEGKKIFPNGNPTLQCDDFFALDNSERWVGQTLKIRHSAIKRSN